MQDDSLLLLSVLWTFVVLFAAYQHEARIRQRLVRDKVEKSLRGPEDQELRAILAPQGISLIAGYRRWGNSIRKVDRAARLVPLFLILPAYSYIAFELIQRMPEHILDIPKNRSFIAASVAYLLVIMMMYFDVYVGGRRTRRALAPYYMAKWALTLIEICTPGERSYGQTMEAIRAFGMLRLHASRNVERFRDYREVYQAAAEYAVLFSSSITETVLLIAGEGLTDEIKRRCTTIAGAILDGVTVDTPCRLLPEELLSHDPSTASDSTATRWGRGKELAGAVLIFVALVLTAGAILVIGQSSAVAIAVLAFGAVLFFVFLPGGEDRLSWLHQFFRNSANGGVAR